MRGNDGARFDLADAGGAIYRERRSRYKTHFRENVACKRWHPLRFFIASGMCAGAPYVISCSRLYTAHVGETGSGFG
jgi:hypothetical protein